MNTFRQFVKQLTEARYPRPGTPEPPPLKGDPLTLFLADPAAADRIAYAARRVRSGAAPRRRAVGMDQEPRSAPGTGQTCTKPIR